MVRRLEPNLLCCDVSLCVQVCLHLVIEENSEAKKTSSDSESNSFANLSKISVMLWRKIRKMVKNL